MLALILGAILIIGGIIAAIIAATEEDVAIGLGGGVTIIIGIVCVIASFFEVVPTGKTGIVTSFGKVEDTPIYEGISFMAPWKSVIKLNNQIQSKDLLMEAYTSDKQTVECDISVAFRIDKSKAQEIYKTMGKDYYNIIEPKFPDVVKTVVGLYTADDLVSDREDIALTIKDRLSALLVNYNIELMDLSIKNFNFTDDYERAVAEKQIATQNKIKAQTEQEQANIEAEAAAERERISAQAAADAAIIAAQADAEIAKIAADSAEYQGQKQSVVLAKIGAQLEEYPDLIYYFYTDRWNGELPETILGESNLLYNIQ